MWPCPRPPGAWPRGRGPAGLDDPAVDAGPQRLGGGRARDRLRPGRGDRRRRRGPQAGGGPGAGRGRGRRGRQGAAPGARWRSCSGPATAGLRPDPDHRRGGGRGLDSGGRRVRHHRATGRALRPTSPAYGAEDLAVGQRYNTPVLHPVGPDGKFGRRDGLAGRPVRQGGRRRPGRGPAPAGAAVAGRDPHPRLPVLLALRHAADLLRADLLVRPDHGRARTGCWPRTPASAGVPSTSATAASATGWPTTSTGRCPGPATGARPCRCGAAATST